MADPARAATPAPEVQRTPEASRPQVQFALPLSRHDDPAEREAEQTADRVMGMGENVVGPRQRVSLLAARSPAPLSPPPSAAINAIRRRLDGAALPAGTGDRDRTTPEAAAAIRGRVGGGMPLPRDTRSFMERRMGANLGGVRVHADGQAQGIAAGLGARALTYGRDIFFGPGEFRPDSREGQHLIAHELTHTIQQRQVVQREPTIHERSAPKVHRSIGSFFSGVANTVGGAVSGAIDAVGDAIGNVVQIVRTFAAEKAAALPGFNLLCLILGRNPISDAPTPGGGAAILRELAGFIPFGGKIVEALENHGIFARGGAFIDQQMAGFRRVVSSVAGAVSTFFGSLGPSDALHPIAAWNRAAAIFSSPINEIKSFASGLVSGFVDLVVDVVLKPLGSWAAANVPHWDLLMAVLGKNPVSGEGGSPAMQIIGAFMTLIGQEEVWTNIQQAKAIPRAWAWFKGALAGAKSLVLSIPGEVMAAIKSFTILDVLTIAGAFRKIVTAFGSFAGKLMGWAGGTVLTLLEIILDVVAPAAVPYLKKAGGAFKTIVQNPIGFVRTLVAAGKAGFQQFAGNFLTHLKASLVGWLTGALGGAGVYIPQGFSFREILKFALSVMGLTWANIRTKLVAVAGETTVKALETGFDIVVTLVRDGPAAAWQQIMETLSNLKQMAIDAVMDFVKSKVVEAAVTKLLSMLSPAGAFIQAIIAIYNTIMFFVERIKQIAQVAAAFIDSLATIAAGNIGPAAARVERTMAGLLTLVISFLARLAGLGNVSDAILGLIKKIRAPIDKALDKLVAWIVATAKKLGKMAVDAVRGKDERTPAQKMQDLQKAVKAMQPTVTSMLKKGIPMPLLKARMLAWKIQYRLSSVELKGRAIVATINPELTVAEGWTFEDTDIFKIIDKIAGEHVEEGRAENAAAGTATVSRTMQTKKGPVDANVEQIDMTKRKSIGAGAAAATTKNRQEFLTGTITDQAAPLAAGHTPEQKVYGFPNWYGIGAGGAGGAKGKRYQDIAQSLAGKPVGEWMDHIVKNKPLPKEAAEHRAALEELSGLLLVKEPSHGQGSRKRDLTYSIMATELMTGPDALPIDKVVGPNALHPAAFGQAQMGAKNVTDEMTGVKGKGKPSPKQVVATTERRRRERDLLVAWFARHKKDLPIQQPKPTLADVEKFVREKIRAFVGGR